MSSVYNIATAVVLAGGFNWLNPSAFAADSGRREVAAKIYIANMKKSKSHSLIFSMLKSDKNA